MTILCEVDEATLAGIAPDVGGELRLAASLPEAALTLAEDEKERLVVIGERTPLEQVLDFTTHVRSGRPGVSVLLVRRQHDPTAVTAALKAGVREVVPASPPDDLIEAMRRAATEPAGLADQGEADRQPEPMGKIVTVFSPKGGSGKTTISTNLAVALSTIAPPVCLVDLDLQFGDVAISLGLSPTRTLGDAVKQQVDGDEDDALAMLTTEYRPGMNCVLAPIEPGDADPIHADLVADLLTLLRGRYAYVVVDTPAQLSPLVLAAMAASDHHVLVTNPEVPALKNLRLTLDMMDLLHYPRNRRAVIFNRVDSKAGFSQEEAEEALKMPITTRVPASRDVPASINRGVPITVARKDHPVSAAIFEFAATVIAPERAGGRKGRRLLGRRAK